MHYTTYLTYVVPLFIAAVRGQTICGFEGSGCGGSGLCCNNANADFCCTFNALFTQSVQFTGIPPSSVVAVLTEDKNGGNCGYACASSDVNSSGAACLSCSNDLMSGGIYYTIGAKREEKVKCSGQVEPHIALIQGHAFSINYNAPENVTEELISLISAGTAYEQVPQHLRAYEVASPI